MVIYLSEQTVLNSASSTGQAESFLLVKFNRKEYFVISLDKHLQEVTLIIPGKDINCIKIGEEIFA
jgi:hypothetical protein